MRLCDLSDGVDFGLETLPPRVAQQLRCQFFNAASDAVTVIDTSGQIVLVNTQAEELFGYRRAELLQQPVAVLMPERMRARHAQHLRRYFANPQPRPMGSTYVGVGLHRSGHEFPIDIALTPLPTESGLYAASAIRDVSKQRQLEAELRQHARDLEMADLHKDRFLSTLAHELGSPLAAIAYAAENLRRNVLPDESRGQAIDIVLEEVRLIQRLLEDLNEVPRIQRGDLPLRKVLTDLAKTSRLAIDISKPLMQQHRHTLEFDSPREPLYIEGDSARLTQIITNLLNNAARYTPDGGRIRISLERDGSDIVLKVADNGIGIPRDMLSRVFDLFTRLDPARTTYTKGMGIGLAFVRRLVEFHGGTVRALSDGEGRGAEFVVRLPQATDAALRD